MEAAGESYLKRHHALTAFASRRGARAEQFGRIEQRRRCVGQLVERKSFHDEPFDFDPYPVDPKSAGSARQSYGRRAQFTGESVPTGNDRPSTKRQSLKSAGSDDPPQSAGPRQPNRQEPAGHESVRHTEDHA